MPEISNLFVVLMGLGTVFFGLICIIFLSTLMSAVCRLLTKKKTAAPAVEAPVVAHAAPAAAPVVDRKAMIAAISAAIAEDLGTDVSAIRIRSFTRVA